MNNKLEKTSILIIVTELLFAIMPLLILLLISILTSQSLLGIFKRSDISFISVLLFGQTSVRLISGYVKKGNKFGWQRVAFVLTVLFIFGLVPSVIYLIVVHSEISKAEIVYVLQNIWLLLSVIVYIIFGCIGQVKLDE
jgi:positive regulator of sigma E activity